MKMNLREFQERIVTLDDPDKAMRLSAVSALAKYTGAEWEGTPEAIDIAIGALLGAEKVKGRDSSQRAFRIELAKVLGNIGTRSTAAVPELQRLVQQDKDDEVRAEAARALGKIGTGANGALQALAKVLKQDCLPQLRTEAVWALARIDPEATEVAPALIGALQDKNATVRVCAAEALWKITHEVEKTLPVLVKALADVEVRRSAAQVLYRIGPAATGAVPALKAAMKDKDRLFHESVVMALQKIGPVPATK